MVFQLLSLVFGVLRQGWVQKGHLLMKSPSSIFARTSISDWDSQSCLSPCLLMGCSYHSGLKYSLKRIVSVHVNIRLIARLIFSRHMIFNSSDVVMTGLSFVKNKEVMEWFSIFRLLWGCYGFFQAILLSAILSIIFSLDAVFRFDLQKRVRFTITFFSESSTNQLILSHIFWKKLKIRENNLVFIMNFFTDISMIELKVRGIK